MSSNSSQSFVDACGSGSAAEAGDSVIPDGCLLEARLAGLALVADPIAKAEHEARVIKCAETCNNLPGELQQWREAWLRICEDHQGGVGMEAITSDYNMFISVVNIRLKGMKSAVERRFTAATAHLKIAGRSRNQRKIDRYQQQVDKAISDADAHNRHANVLRPIQDELRSSAEFIQLKLWFDEKYVVAGGGGQIRNGGILVEKKDLDADNAQTFEATLASLKMEEDTLTRKATK